MAKRTETIHPLFRAIMLALKTRPFETWERVTHIPGVTMPNSPDLPEMLYFSRTLPSGRTLMAHFAHHSDLSMKFVYFILGSDKTSGVYDCGTADGLTSAIAFALPGVGDYRDADAIYAAHESFELSEVERLWPTDDSLTFADDFNIHDVCWPYFA